jgi:Dolichyl-phosphate-mannose-protein mannosyltransferase
MGCVTSITRPDGAPGTRTDLVILASLGGIAALAFAVRLFVGLQTNLDADEAVEAIAALHILKGHFVLMEADAHYLGALDSYILAPFVFLFGTTLLAVRLCFSVVGAVYATAMFFLGRSIFGDRRKGLAMAAISAVFPLFAITFGIRARTYGVLLPLEALLLLMTIRIGWAKRPVLRRDWVLLGLVAGVAVWHDVLLAVPLVICGLLLLGRARAIGWLRLRQGLGIAAVAALVGFSPWIVYNLLTRLGSLRHLYTPLSVYSVPTLTAAGQVLTRALPIFVGARVNFCGPEVVPAWVVDAGMGLLAVAVLWLRRSSAVAALHGQLSELDPVDWALLVAPLAVAVVTIHWFNSLSCEPRYLMPLAVPLVLVVTLLLVAHGPMRVAGAIALAGCLAMSAITVNTTIETRHNLVVVPGAPQTKVDLALAAAALERLRPEAIWAQYWLARPIEFYSGDRFIVGEYGGYVGFPEIQTAALAAAHPSWLFVEGDPKMVIFEAECARRGVTYQRSTPIAGLVFFDHLSGRLIPDDLGFRTQTVGQAA